MESYQISSKTGMRHMVPGPPPAKDEVLKMWSGRVLPVAKCGKAIQVVNFYEPDERHINPRSQCSRCFKVV